MRGYDEYQKLMQYRHGYHAFWIVVVLWLISYFFNLVLDMQWAETAEVETTLILYAGLVYMTVMDVYRGAHFRKYENPKLQIPFLLLFSVFLLLEFFSRDLGIIVNGKITSEVYMFVAALTPLALVLTYGVRVLVKKKEGKQNEDS